MSELERLGAIADGIRLGNNKANQLKYDKYSKSIRPSSYYDDPDQTIPITKLDADLFAD